MWTIIFNFIGEIPESKYRKELDAVYKKAQNALGKDTVEDEDMDKKEKEFLKERKKLDRAAKAAEKKNSSKKEIKK